MNAFDLTGEVALITGGGTGIGLGMARCMVASGARVVIMGRREDVLQSAVKELGENASYEVGDVDDFDAIPSLVERVEKNVGPISILCNNAGSHIKKPAIEHTEEDFQRVLNVHVLGTHAMTRNIAPRMIERGKGSIILTASMTSFMGMPLVVAYAAAKSAFVGMVRSYSSEFAPHGVRVNAIAPGWIHSAMTDKALNDDPPRKAKVLSRTPMGKLGEPEDIGWAAVYLAAPASRFVSGVILPVDGGAQANF